MKSILLTTAKGFIRDLIGILILLCLVWLLAFTHDYNFIGGVFSLNSFLSASIIYIVCNSINLLLSKVKFSFEVLKK